MYRALNPELQLWVAACLYWGYIDTIAKLRGELSAERASAIYQMAAPLGTTLQVREGMWPKDMDAFATYREAQMQNFLSFIVFMLINPLKVRKNHSGVSLM